MRNEIEPTLVAQIRSILILPFNVTVTIPLFLLLFFSFDFAWGIEPTVSILVVFVGVLFTSLGLILLISSIRLFSKKGKGTLAPWQPPGHLVVSGVYQYSRNPMIGGVVLILLGEVIVFGSLAVMIWFLLFFVVNYVYFVFKEEPALEEKFGEEYREYKRNVPRLLPRRKP